MGRAMDFSYADDKSNPVERALKTDPLYAAEQITGKSYKDDKETSALGMLLAMEHNHDKAALLSEQDDTNYKTSWLTFLRIIEEEGFEIESLTSYTYDKHGEPRKMHMLVAVHPQEGILIQASSYRFYPAEDERLNTAVMRYNIVFNEGVSPWSFTSTGCLTEVDGQDVWSGNHDIREGFRHNLKNLRDNGSFLKPWAIMPWMTPNLNLVELNTYWNLDSDWTSEGREVTRLNLLKTFESVPAALELFVDAKQR